MEGRDILCLAGFVLLAVLIHSAWAGAPDKIEMTQFIVGGCTVTILRAIRREQRP